MMNVDASTKALERVPEPVRSDPEFLACHKLREERARMSREAQATYQDRQTRVIIATTVAAVLGSLLLYGFDPAPVPDDPTFSILLRDWLSNDSVRIALAVLQAVALGIVAWSVHLVRGTRDEETWLENRMAAEEGRIKRAFTALKIGHRSGSEAFSAAGAYALKELLDDQLSYFESAKALHTRRSARLLRVGGIVSAVGAGFAVLQGLGIPELLLAAALVGVLSPALNAAVTSWEAVSGDMERARARATAWFALTEVSGERKTFDTALANQDLPGAEAYLVRVAQILRADHKAFEAMRKTSKREA